MNGITAYQEHRVVTQSPARLIVLLYDGAIKFLKQAIEHMQAGDIVAKSEAVGRATEIIIELDSVLNMEAGGEIAENLRKLYDFMARRITVAHVRNNPQMLREVIKLLEDLNDGWKAVVD